jgi:deazaflavin-dependent oxidoreductase (nitroreductase family)
MRRLLIWIARIPALADRRGLRWLLSGRLIGAPIAILVHRGRRSGRIYRTPVEAIVEQPGEIVISPARGRRGDWYRNITAGGLVEVRLRGCGYRAESRELSEDENVSALRGYRDAHPIYGRIVLWVLARTHRLKGDPLAAVARGLPMLSLRLEAQTRASSEPAREISAVP